MNSSLIKNQAQFLSTNKCKLFLYLLICDKNLKKKWSKQNFVSVCIGVKASSQRCLTLEKGKIKKRKIHKFAEKIRKKFRNRQRRQFFKNKHHQHYYCYYYRHHRISIINSFYFPLWNCENLKKDWRDKKNCGKNEPFCKRKLSDDLTERLHLRLDLHVKRSNGISVWKNKAKKEISHISSSHDLIVRIWTQIEIIENILTFTRLLFYNLSGWKSNWRFYFVSQHHSRLLFLQRSKRR